MKDIVVRAEHLGKRYRLRDRSSLSALADLIKRKFGRMRGAPTNAVEAAPDFWALEDVSFEIRKGEIVGIIGPNGAGKSTLLKILCRITSPTTGSAEINGKVGMLLEVGTGFHPDLSGRENVFLGGAILGMTNEEIERKYDDIVEFAGIADFMEMPVRHYSSGMSVRLALSVAIHLEADIIFLDEVWAVGDQAFQQKSLRRIEEMIASGRTFIIVTHSAPTIQRLCDRCLLLENGRLIMDDTPEKVLARYSAEVGEQGQVRAKPSAAAPGPLPDAMSQSRCRSCRAPLTGAKLDLGVQPSSNGFATYPRQDVYPLSMTACPQCGLVQLTDLAASSAIVPQVPCIRYKEPEVHLDAVSDRIQALIAPTTKHGAASALGLGPFDDILLQRLKARGFDVATIDLLAGDAASDGHFPYLETIQAGIRSEAMATRADRIGSAELVVCRFLLEHCHDPVDALRALAMLAKPDGLVLIEVPDSRKFLARKDYSFIWEEHVCNFTEETLRGVLARAGFAVVEMLSYPSYLEDALVAICRPHGGGAASEVAPSDLFDEYRAAFPILRAGWNAAVERLARGGKIVLYGASHQALMFANVMGLRARIAYIVDDDPAKQGYFPPGMSQPIASRETMLADAEVTLCLLAMYPGAHAKVRLNCASLVRRGGQILSLFPKGEGDTPIELPPNGLIRKSAEIFLAPGPIVTIDGDALDFLRHAVLAAPRQRVQIDLHGDDGDSLRDVIVAIRPQSYIRPHKHPGKSESLHVIDGKVDVVIFDELGEIVEVLALSSDASAGGCSFRISKPLFHSLVIHSEILVAHEITDGPFRPNDTVLAPFSPDEADLDAAARYAATLRQRVAALKVPRS